MGGNIAKMFGFIFFLCSLFAAGTAQAKVFVVNSPLDLSVCSGICTLRGAIEAANNNGESDVIHIDQKIKYIPISSELFISGLGAGIENLTIKGNAVIDAQKKSRVFFVGKGSYAVMDGIGISGGYLSGTSSLQGAGIYNEGILELYNAKIFGNLIKYNSSKKKSAVRGAGVYNAYGATLIIKKSYIGPRNILELEGVDAEAQGAGIYSDGLLSIEHSNVFNNKASAKSKAEKGFAKAEGGGVFSTASKPAYMYGSSVYANRVETVIEEKSMNASADGAGLYIDSSSKLYMTNSTVSGNESISFGYSSPESYALAHGGAIYSGTYSKVYLANVTIANNSATVPTSAYPAGAAVGHSIFAVSAPGYVFKVKNSIISSKGENCIYKIESEGNNVVSDSSCFAAAKAGDKVFVDPLLSPLAQNGGFTKTHALMAESPAIDAGNNGGCYDYSEELLETDQRGSYRPKNACDSGAYEL